MNNTLPANETDRKEITLLICEHCFEIIFEDDAEYNEEIPYCHCCIEGVRSLGGLPAEPDKPLLFVSRAHRQALRYCS